MCRLATPAPDKHSCTLELLCVHTSMHATRSYHSRLICNIIMTQAVNPMLKCKDTLNFLYSYMFASKEQ